MERLSRGYGAILTFFAAIAGVLSRNLPSVGFKLTWANEVSDTRSI